MSMVPVRSFRAPAAGLSAAAVLLAASSAHAAVQIHFTGMNLVYDGSAIHDGGSTSGGLADPADADALATVDFFNDGVLVGSITSDASLDVFIPGVTGLTTGPGAQNITTAGNGGFFDLLFGTSPLASEFLIVDIASVSLTYLDIGGFAEFLFAGTISETYAQNLPFGLSIVGPVTISFSAQVSDITSSDGAITGFNAFGTGEFEAVPAPASALLIGLGSVAVRRRRSA